MADDSSIPPKHTKPRQHSVSGRHLVGSKWVDLNWSSMKEAAEANGGKLPYSVALITSNYPNTDTWSEECLPEILFYLIAPRSKYHGQPVTNKVTEDGRTLRDFQILPDRISIDVEGWLIEAWRRIDDRISYTDIIERMTADPDFCNGKGLVVPSRNSLQMETHRACRKVLGTWQVYGRREEPHRTTVEAIEKLSPENFIYNTVLPRSKVASSRLARLKFERQSEDGQWKPVPVQETFENLKDTTFSLTYFSWHLPGGLGKVDEFMTKSVEILFALQERARVHGVAHWSKLPKWCRPVSWSDRTKGAEPKNRREGDEEGDDRAKEIPDHYDGGCDICTWREGRGDGQLGIIPTSIDLSKKRNRKVSADMPGSAPKRQRRAAMEPNQQVRLQPSQYTHGSSSPENEERNYNTTKVVASKDINGTEGEDGQDEYLLTGTLPSSTVSFSDGLFLPSSTPACDYGDIDDSAIFNSSPPSFNLDFHNDLSATETRNADAGTKPIPGPAARAQHECWTGVPLQPATGTAECDPFSSFNHMQYQREWQPLPIPGTWTLDANPFANRSFNSFSDLGEINSGLSQSFSSGQSLTSFGYSSSFEDTPLQQQYSIGLAQLKQRDLGAVQSRSLDLQRAVRNSPTVFDSLALPSMSQDTTYCQPAQAINHAQPPWFTSLPAMPQRRLANQSWTQQYGVGAFRSGGVDSFMNMAFTPPMSSEDDQHGFIPVTNNCTTNVSTRPGGNSSYEYLGDMLHSDEYN